MQEIERLKCKISDKVSECLELVNARCPNSPMKFVGVKFDLDGRTLGIANYVSQTININMKYAVQDPDHCLNITVPHEIAHLADYHFYNNWGHGKTWKRIMRVIFNLEPKATADIETPPDIKRNKMNTFVYTCACPGKEIKVGIRRHKIISSGRFAKCVECLTRIQYKAYIGKV